MDALVDAYCLLGSNLGDRIDLLRQAVMRLPAGGRIEVLAVSRVYESAPWGGVDQPAYLNAAVHLRTSLSPDDLLSRFQEIEAALGRRRAAEERWGPRPVDLDLALFADVIQQNERLTLPHPHLGRRAFALMPLLEMAPGLRHPGNGRPLREMLDDLPEADRRVCRIWGDLMADVDSPDGALPAGGLFRSRSAEETQALGHRLGVAMRGGEIIAQVGNLGAGKTCFAGGFARGLGIQSAVTSPSYVLVKSYEGGRLILHHADFYRLTGDGTQDDPPDLASLGLEDYLHDPEAVVLVEWADRFPTWLEPPFWLVEIVLNGASDRLLLIRRIH